MPPKPASTALTDAETKFLGQAWQSANGDLNKHIDIDKLSKLAGHTNPGSTRNTLNRITKKLKETCGASDANTSSPTATPTPYNSAKSSGSNARKRKVDEGLTMDVQSSSEDDYHMEAVLTGKAKPKEEVAAETKSAKANGKKSTAKKAKTENGDGGTNGPAMPVKTAGANGRARSPTLVAGSPPANSFTSVNTSEKTKEKKSGAAKSKVNGNDAEKKSAAVVKDEEDDDEPGI